MQYQYLGTYENYQLQCPKCSEVFLARGIHRTAPSSNGAGGFGWHFDPQRQDLGFNKQPASAAAFSGAGNGFMNGGLGGFNSFPNQSPSAAFFVAQSNVAAAAAACSAVPPNNLAADVVQQIFDKLERERVEAVKQVERKEKELRKKEKEKNVQRKGLGFREAMERLMAKHKEQEMACRDVAGKGKVDARAGRKLKRKKGDSEQEDEEDLEDDDPKVYEQRMQDDDLSSLGRRSSGAKKNVATYEVDFSDDSDLDDFPVAKQVKCEGDAEDVVKSEDEDEEVSRKQSNNSMKGKSVQNDSNFVKQGVGAKSGEELDGSRHAREKNRGDEGGAAKKNPHKNSNFVETARESTPHGSRMKTMKTHRYRASHQDSRNEKSPSKSQSTLRNRIRSPQVPFGSKFEEDFEDMPQQRVSSPTHSLASIPSSEPDAEEDSEDFEEDWNERKIVVPNPDFHDFDAHRNETDILPGQVWAIYDDRDGMPRFNCQISRVSTKPFRAHINWLQPSALSDNENAWTESTGLSLTCGEFKIGKNAIMDQINTFSHVVMERSEKAGMLKIYPKKGQVWAVYRNSAEQRIGSARVVRSNGGSPYTYDMVEILSEFLDERSLKAAILFKISGFKTVFSRHKDMEEFRYFKPTELVKFSHNVPNQRIDDVEAERCGIPRGALELDPASTPLDLIMSPSDPSE